MERLAACAKPTIAMIRGWCIGGGLALAVGCDLRIATDGSRFGIPAARLGVGYGAAGVNKLMQLVGRPSPRKSSSPRAISRPPRPARWA